MLACSSRILYLLIIWSSKTGSDGSHDVKLGKRGSQFENKQTPNVLSRVFSTEARLDDLPEADIRSLLGVAKGLGSNLEAAANFVFNDFLENF